MSPFESCCHPKKEKRPSIVKDTAPPKSSDPVNAGPSEQDVDALVDQILKDPSINISLIPDSVERLIYKSTIQLTVNAFYSVLSGLEGAKFMAHQIHLNIARGSERDDNNDQMKSRSCLLMEPSPTSDIDDLVLEEVATRLLTNKAINQRFLPDRIEHMLYTNCLKVVFRMLDILTGSLHMTVCGHDIGLFLEPAAWQEIARNTATTSPLSEIDQEKLHEFARMEAGIEEELGLWDSLFVPKHFVAQLHASLYGLILGIADDMLNNTKLEILSDTITFDIAPIPEMEGTKDRSWRYSSKCDESHTTAESTSSAFDSSQPQDLSRQLESVGFETERAIFLQRFQEMTPEQRAVLAKDMNALLGFAGSS